jgi:MinD-like ATPase involved in chromosome partitioning or flagellar assembly
MSRTISIHSFRGGTGKSNMTSNIAAAIASQGKRVGIVDTDIQSPGIHVIFNLGEDGITHSLNDYLWGRCAIEETAHDVTPAAVAERGGQIYLIPSSIKTGEIAKILREGYDVGMLNEGFQHLGDSLDLDYLMIDTHPGLNEETLLSVAISDALVIILRPDRQDYQGTAVAVEVARSLEVPNLFLLVNKAIPSVDPESLREKVQAAYGAPVIGVFPHSDLMLELASGGIYCLEHPDDPFSQQIAAVAQTLMAASEVRPE